MLYCSLCTPPCPLTLLSQVRWRINGHILDTVLTCLRDKIAVGDLPVGEDLPLPPVPEGVIVDGRGMLRAPTKRDGEEEEDFKERRKRHYAYRRLVEKVRVARNYFWVGFVFFFLRFLVCEQNGVKGRGGGMIWFRVRLLARLFIQYKAKPCSPFSSHFRQGGSFLSVWHPCNSRGGRVPRGPRYWVFAFDCRIP